MRPRGTAPRPNGPASAWEWVVAAIGALIVLTIVGYLGWNAATSRDAPPAVAVSMDRIHVQGDGYVVTFRAINRGAAAAEEVKITGRLVRGAETLEEAEATLAYVPAGSVRRGGLFFSRDPATGALELRAEGYSKP